MKVIAIIPARAGSKGILAKNIVDLNGKPLISYTIEQALKVNIFDKIIVSTESMIIKKISEEWGANVPFLRSPSLSTDHAKTVDVVLEVLDTLLSKFGEKYDVVCLLQPTSPLRTLRDILNCVDLFNKKSPDSVVSLTRISEPHPHKMKTIVEGYVRPYQKGKDSSTPRQLLPEVYELNGAIYLTKTSVLKNERSFFGSNCIPYIMPKVRSVNINHPLDLKMASIILEDKDD